MNVFKKWWKFIIVEIILLVNGIVSLLGIMPDWFNHGYYDLPDWISTGLSFSIAAVLLAALLWEHRRIT